MYVLNIVGHVFPNRDFCCFSDVSIGGCPKKQRGTERHYNNNSHSGVRWYEVEEVDLEDIVGGVGAVIGWRLPWDFGGGQSRQGPYGPLLLLAREGRCR